MKLKFTTLLSAFFAACFFCAFSFAQDAPKPPLKRAGVSIRSETYSYKFSNLDFTDTPSWKAESGEPPLSISKATEIARQSLPRFVQNVGDWKIRSVNLHSIGEDKWYYSIAFTCFGIQCRDLPERRFISVVKMDGTIIEPKKLVEQ